MTGDVVLGRAWSDRDAHEAAARALARWGLVGREMELLRLGENATFRVLGTDVVLRVARPGTSRESVVRMVQAASVLHAAGIAVAQPIGSPEDVEVFPTGVVSAWVYYEQLSRETFEYEDFGQLLEQFHRLGAPVAELLSPWQPLEMTRHRLAVLPEVGVPAEWVTFLKQLATSVERDLAGIGEQDVGVIHGDAHSGNALRTDSGLVLVDLDNLAIGPRAVDFVPTLVQDRRFERSSDRWSEVSRGYGYDGVPVPADSPLIRLRELHMVVWLLQQWGLDENSDRELAIRVASLDDPPDRLTRWNPH